MTWESLSRDNVYQRASPARSGTQLSVFSQSLVEQGPRAISATTTVPVTEILFHAILTRVRPQLLRGSNFRECMPSCT